MLKPVPTFDELINLLNSDTPPTDLGWMVYQFLKTNIGEGLTSKEARTLLLIYLRLPVQRPSVLHSVMLNVALKAAEQYPDFKLPGFLEMWDVTNLTPGDYNPQHDKEGRQFMPLASRMSICAMRYHMVHPDEKFDERTRAVVLKQAAELGYLPALKMVAVKIFETEHNRRKLRMVKLVGPQGQELAAEIHAFACRPWEITGRMYDVLRRRSQTTDKERVDAISLSRANVEDVFGRKMGFVDRYDVAHKHYHIFDSDGLHFVAEDPKTRIKVGDFVWFSPIIPAEDKFKTAIVITTVDTATGMDAFGTTAAKVTKINEEKGYFAYITSDGTTGFANLTLLPGASVGSEVRLVIYPRRGKDGQKRPYVGFVSL